LSGGGLFRTRENPSPELGGRVSILPVGEAVCQYLLSGFPLLEELGFAGWFDMQENVSTIGDRIL
jgi:hypothetical protein